MFEFGVGNGSDMDSVAGSVAAGSTGDSASGVASTVTHFSVQSLMDEQAPEEEDGAKSCPTCGELVNKGKKYCPKHHRAYECLETSHVKKGTGKEAEAFYAIFGRRARKQSAKKPAVTFVPCDQALANETLLEFLQNFPEGKETKVGKKRGDMKLTSAVSSEGTRQSNDDVARRRLYDQELFVTAMHTMRGWMAEKAMTEWNNLVASTPEELKKYGGARAIPCKCQCLPSCSANSSRKIGPANSRSMPWSPQAKVRA